MSPGAGLHQPRTNRTQLSSRKTFFTYFFLNTANRKNLSLRALADVTTLATGCSSSPTTFYRFSSITIDETYETAFYPFSSITIDETYETTFYRFSSITIDETYETAGNCWGDVERIPKQTKHSNRNSESNQTQKVRPCSSKRLLNFTLLFIKTFADKFLLVKTDETHFCSWKPTNCG